MADYAYIEVTRHALPFGHTYETFRWVGPLDAPVYVDERSLAQFPWPLRKMEWCVEYLGWKCLRTDTDNWRWAYLREKLTPFFGRLKCRIILTLYVWDLAAHEPNRRLEWSDIGWRKGLH